MQGALRKGLKIAGWTLAGLAALGIALWLVALAVNWRDRPPSEAATRFANLHRDRPPLADSDNAFVYLSRLEPARPQRARAVQAYIDGCARNSADCRVTFANGEAILAEWMAVEPGLLERYRTFIAHAGWREAVPTSFDAPFPPYARVMDGQKLLMLHAKGLAAKGDAAGVNRLLEEDLVFWRTVLESSDLLITKMIATVAINRDFEVGNLVLRELPGPAASVAIPASWRTPMSDAERSMLRTLVGEWRYSFTALANVNRVSEGQPVERIAAALSLRFFQPQDTANRFAEHNARIAQIMAVPLDQYGAALQKASDEADERRDAAFPPHSLYNVVGSILIASVASDFALYARRVGDIEGVRRASLAAVTLREANVRASDVPAALESSALRNPYDGRPFAWDAKDGSIVFTGLELSKRGEHRILY